MKNENNNIFTYYIDRFCTVWIRDTVSVYADNEKKALKILSKEFNDYCKNNGNISNIDDIILEEVEVYPETESIVDPSRTHGKATVIVFDELNNLILDNTLLQKKHIS